MGRFLILLASFALFTNTSHKARANSQELEEAEKQFTAKNFAAAKEIYDKNSNSQNPASLYNLALTEIKMNSLGASYYHLLLAKKISPWDSDISNNIKYVISQLSPSAQQIRPAGRLLDYLPEFLHVHFAIPVTLALLCLSAYLLIAIGAWNNSAASAFFLSFCVLFSILGAMSFYDDKLNTAVVVNSKATLHSGPASSFSEITEIPEGALVKIGDEKNGWNKLSFKTPQNNETVGWAESSSLAIVTSNAF